MTAYQGPACRHCSGIDWALECVVTTLVYGFSHDASGPFKREATVDRVRTLHFWCEGCGEAPDPACEAILAAAYRSHDRERSATRPRALYSPKSAISTLRRGWSRVRCSADPSVTRSGAGARRGSQDHKSLWEL